MFTWSMANKSVHRCPPGRRPSPRRGPPEAAVTRGGGSGSGAGRAGGRRRRRVPVGAGDAVAGFPGRCPAHEQAAGAEPGREGRGCWGRRRRSLTGAPRPPPAVLPGAELRHDRLVRPHDLEGADGGDGQREPHRGGAEVNLPGTGRTATITATRRGETPRGGGG